MSTFTNKGLTLLATSGLSGLTLKAGLLLNTYAAADPDDDFVADVSAHEPSDGSYARVALSGLTISEDDVNNRTVIDVGNPDFGALDNTAGIRWLMIYAEGTNDDDSVVIGFARLVDGEGDPKDYTANGAGFTVTVEPLAYLNVA